jgi:hypothetical protein
MEPFIKLEFKKPNLGNFFASFKIIDSFDIIVENTSFWAPSKNTRISYVTTMFDIQSQDNFCLAKT